jgi:hypothetical protein
VSYQDVSYTDNRHFLLIDCRKHLIDKCISVFSVCNNFADQNSTLRSLYSEKSFIDDNTVRKDLIQPTSVLCLQSFLIYNIFMSLLGSNHLSKSRVFIPLRHYNMMLCTISISIANIDYLFQDLANNDLTMGEFVMRAIDMNTFCYFPDS